MHPVITILLMLSPVALLSGCEERGVNIKIKMTSNQGPSRGGENPAIEAQFKSNVNLKSGEELRHAFARLTGVSPEQGAAIGNDYPGGDQLGSLPVNIASIFVRARPLLTSNNELSGLSEFKQLSVMKLAAGFCHQVACNPAGTSPGGSPAYLLGLTSSTLAQAYGTQQLRQEFATALVRQLMGPVEQEEILNRSEAVEIVAEYVGELLQNSAIVPSCTNVQTGITENAKVRSVAKAACTLVLSSLPVTKL